MNSRLPDPDNLVPEISPDDRWEDAAKPAAESPPQASVLPTRRAAAQHPARATAPSIDNPSSGLRIDSQVLRAEHPESAQRLEIQEIKSGVVRLDQVEPFPPKAVRQVAFHERQIHEKDQSNSSGESSTWGATRQLPKLWIIGSGAGVLIIVILFMALLPVINSLGTKKNSRPSTDAKPFVEEKIERIDDIDLMLTKQTEALQIFRAYLAATRVEDVIPLIRDGKAMEQALRSHWLPAERSNRRVFGTKSIWSLKEIAGHACGILTGTLPDQSPFSAYFTNDENRLLMDWKATSSFSTATFTELEKNAGDPTEIRGVISLAEFYTSSWPEVDYQSFRLTSQDGQDIIWCYARRREPPYEALSPFFRKNLLIAQDATSWKITLRLARGPADALPNQWLIGEMLHIDWVTP